MQKKTRISVAMVSYNGGQYIGEQIASILPQLGEQDELVVSDDGSSDQTLKVLREYQKQDPRIRLLKGPQKGIKKNVEHALRHTKGEYIFLADQDDVWMPDKVGQVMEVFEEQKAMVVIHDAAVFEETPCKDVPASSGSGGAPCPASDTCDGLAGVDGGAAGTGRMITIESFFQFRGSGAGVFKNMLKNSYIGCCMAFRRELLSIALPIPGRIEMHDQWLGILGDYVAGKSCFLEKKLLLYRRHGENNSSMEHYGIGKMLRNRIVFFGYFFVRILQFQQKRQRFFGNFKKNNG